MKKTRKSVTRSTHKLLLIPTTKRPKLREPGASYRSAVGRENLFSKEPLLQAAIVIWRRLRGGHLKPFVPKKFCIQLWKPMDRHVKLALLDQLHVDLHHQVHVPWLRRVRLDPGPVPFSLSFRLVSFSPRPSQKNFSDFSTLEILIIVCRYFIFACP